MSIATNPKLWDDLSYEQPGGFFILSWTNFLVCVDYEIVIGISIFMKGLEIFKELLIGSLKAQGAAAGSKEASWLLAPNFLSCRKPWLARLSAHSYSSGDSLEHSISCRQK